MKNKKILILGGTGFVGYELKKILKQNNTVISVGAKGKNYFVLGKELGPNLKKEISSADLVIFCSWNFKAEETRYVELHVNSVNKVIDICEKNKTSFLFISTYLANKNSKSIYNKAKYYCEKTTVNRDHSVMKISVLKSDKSLPGNIYLKLSKMPSFFGYKLMLKPNNKKFIIHNPKEISNFFDTFKLNSVNIFYDQKKEKVSLSDVLESFSTKNYKYIFVNWIYIYNLLKFLNFVGVRSRVNTDSILSIWGE